MATRVLAEHLAKQFPNQKILVVSNPFSQKKGQPRHVYDYEEAGIGGLKRGFGEDKLVVGFPALLPGALEDPHSVPVPPATTTPVAFLLADNALDTLAQKHPGCNLIVSLIGLPTDLRKHQVWEQTNGTKLAFLLPDIWMLGDRDTILKAFKSGKIAAAVLNKPGASADQMKVSVKDFGVRYLLVTAANIEETITNYPSLFETIEAFQPETNPGK